MTRLLLILAALCSIGASAQTPLRVGVPVSDSLGVRGEHVYTVRLGARQLIAGDADGPAVDVVVRIVGPRGDTLAAFDKGARGPEPFQLTTAPAGTYRIVVSPFRDESGRYTLTLRLAEPIATDAAGRLRQRFLELDGPDRPAVSVATIARGRVAASFAMGRADIEADTPATPETRLDIGRLSMSMTSAALLLLADAGRLDLDADLATLLPDLPAPTGVLTVRDLLNSRTGYLDVATVAGLRAPALGVLRGQAAVDTALAVQGRLDPRAARQRPLRPTEGSLETERMVIARLVEKVTGQPFGAWMQRRLFRPLGMAHTVVRSDPDVRVPRLAATYGRLGETQRRALQAQVPPLRRVDGAPSAWNAVFSTAPDLARWAVALGEPAAGGLLGRMVVGQTMSYTPQYGLYAERISGGGVRVSASDLSGAGSIELRYDQARRAGYAVLTAGPVPTLSLIAALRDDLGETGYGTGAGTGGFRPEVLTEASAARFDSLAGGRYVAREIGAEVFLDVNMSGVGVRLNGGPRLVAEARDGYRYEAPAPLGTFRFEFDRSAEPPVRMLVLSGPGRDGIRFRRVADGG